MLRENLLQFSILAQYQFQISNHISHDSKMQIEHKHKSQKISQDKRTQDVVSASDKPQCGETLDQFFLYSSIVQQREIVHIHQKSTL